MSEAITIKGIDENGQRISSKDFEDLVQKAYEQTDKLVLESYGQHNVAGRLKTGGRKIQVEVNGPCGQRLGSMGMPGTKIICNGPVSDDVGYLNIGAEITVLGHATNGACNAMAEGKVYVKGSIGARGLTMTKWNPEHNRPQLWVLGSVGDTFAEFNCGGVGIVCGIDPKKPDNVLGYRPCVGMVGGWIYYRGKTDHSYDRSSVRAVLPDDEQWQWLVSRLPAYLEKIGRMDLLDTLSVREGWKMLESIPPQEKALSFSGPLPMEDFRRNYWEKTFGGDPIRDLAPGLDRSPIGMIETGDLRRRRPFWSNQESAAPCTYYCPVHIPTIERLRLLREGNEREAYDLVLEYTPFPASVCGSICPNLCMQNCSRQVIDSSIDVRRLGRSARDHNPPEVKENLNKKVAIIGGGPGGMNAAWQLARSGVETHIYERSDQLGGKLAQVIPWERLPRAIWETEIDRFMRTPNINVHFNENITRERFQEIKDQHDYVIVAVGTHEPRTIPFPGHEKVKPALDFLKEAKSDNPPQMSGQVVVIGAGNVGCDVACECYRLGADQVTLVDIQKPLAFGAEKKAAEALGAKFRWPVHTKEVIDAGLIDADGELIPAQTVIISIGDVPALGFLPDSVEVLTVGGAGWVKTDEACRTTDSKIFAVGDVEKPGLATNALGAGKNAAHAIVAEIKGEEWQPFRDDVIRIESLTEAHYEPASCPGSTDMDEAERCMSCGTCRDCHLCETICPTSAISREKLMGDEYRYVSDDEKCIACGFCADTCPCGVWVMQPFN